MFNSIVISNEKVPVVKMALAQEISWHECSGDWITLKTMNQFQGLKMKVPSRVDQAVVV